MKKSILVTLIATAAIFSTTTYADNPGMGGKENRPVENHGGMHQSGENERDHMGQMGEHGDDAPGMDKQRDMKPEQDQKELERGSEQGQDSRDHRKKWWRFWD